MKINDLFKNNNGEVVKVVEIDEARKTCMIETTDGKTKQLSFSTLKDKRRWIPAKEDDQHIVEAVEAAEVIYEDTCGDGTPLAEVGKEIAAQAKEKAKKASSKRNLIEYNGKALTLHGWAKELGIPFGTLYARITRFNWTYEEALSGVKNK